MKSPSRAELLRQLHTRLGGRTTLRQLARAAITDGIFPADIRRDTALAACGRALTAPRAGGLPFAIAMPIRNRDADA